MRDGFLINAYKVAADGFPPHLYYARSRGWALRQSWLSYCSYRDVTFKEWLCMVRCWKEGAPGPRFGAEITVGGKPAFFVSMDNQYVQFSRPGVTDYFNAHPYDVEPVEFRPWTYRSDGS